MGAAEVLNTDKAPAYAAAIAELKAEGKCPKDTRHRPGEIPQQRHRGRPRQAQAADPARARFKTLKTAYATIKGLRGDARAAQGPGRMFALQGGIVGEARIVERAFVSDRAP